MSSPGSIPPQPPAAFRPPEKKRYSAFQALYMAFYSGDLYQDVLQRWHGVGAGYLLLVVVLSWVPLLAKIQVGMSDFARNDAPKFLQQIPPITIDKGKVSTTVETPYFIKDEHGKDFAIIDLTGQITSLDGRDAKLLVMPSKVLARQSAMEVREYDLSQVQHFELTREKVRSWLDLFKSGFILILAPFAILFGYIYRILQLLLYAAVGMAFASMNKLKVEYGVMMRLTAVAVTPAILVNAVYDLAGKGVPLWNFICLGIALCYLFFAVKSAAAAQAPVAHGGTGQAG